LLKDATWPLLQSFILRTNSLYHFIDADQLVTQYSLAFDDSARLPKHIVYTLCLCISIGCQVHDGETDQMALVWYEHGRRYLDNEDWGWSLYVMRALALISMFHRTERPSTASHYLDAALRIGEANNLPLAMENGPTMDTMADNEWVLVWSTIQMMTVDGYTYRGLIS